MPFITLYGQKRKEHPQASLIPESVYNRFFDAAKILEDDLALMKMPVPDDISTLFNSRTTHHSHNRQQTWIAIAYGHPELNDHELLDLGRKLNLSASDFLVLSVYFERPGFFSLVLQTFNDAFLSPSLNKQIVQCFGEAASLGHLAFMNSLMTYITPDMISRSVEHPQSRILANACYTGNPDVIECLLSYVSQGQARNVAANAFSFALSGGHLDIIKRLIKLFPEEHVPAMVAKHFISSFRSNNLDIIKYLIMFIPKEVPAILARDGYLVFGSACKETNLDAIKYLLTLVPQQEHSKMITPYTLRCAVGHLDILKYLITLAPMEKVLDIITGQNENLFKRAASEGQLDAMKYLMALAPKEKILNEWVLKGAFNAAASEGHLDVMKYLVSLVPQEEVSAMVAGDRYEAFSSAAHDGRPDVIEYINRLMDLTPDAFIYLEDNYQYADVHSKEYIYSSKYAATYVTARLSALRAEQAVDITNPDEARVCFYMLRNLILRNDPTLLNDIQFLLGFPAVKALVRAEVSWNKLNELLCVAFGNSNKQALAILLEMPESSSHLDIINRAHELLGAEQFQAILEFNYHQMLRSLARNCVHEGAQESFNRLMELSPYAFDHVERHTWEYTQVTTPFVETRLTSLRAGRDEVEGADQNAVFDITNSDEAKVCFYMLRNLIRRNDPTLSDDIRFLLGIPAVKALVHTAVTLNEPNELLRLALTTNNQEAAGLLLEIPAVRQLAEQRQFYRAEVQGNFDLEAVVLDRESSLRALSTSEQKRLDKAFARYQPLIKEHGIEPFFQILLDTLEELYTDDPAVVKTGDGRVIELPLRWDDWKKLAKTLSADTRKLALEAYAQHRDHTALRYLSRPNHWMAKNAPYVNHGSEGAWSTFEEYKPLITILWLAASDKNTDKDVAPLDGFTVETRMDHFIDELAQIGRAHNWDATRFDTGEEYDDLQGDKPSCYSGVKRRLFQSVLGHPLLKILTLDDIKQELREFVRGHFEKSITEENHTRLSAAWDKLCEEARFHPILKTLDINPEEQEEFIQYLTEKYLAQFNDDPEFRKHIEDSFKITPHYQAHAVRFAGITGLDALLNTPKLKSSESKIPAFSGSINATHITKAKMRLTPCGKIGAAVMDEIRALEHGTSSGSAKDESKELLIEIIMAVNTPDNFSEEMLRNALSDNESSLHKALSAAVINQHGTKHSLAGIQCILNQSMEKMGLGPEPKSI